MERRENSRPQIKYYKLEEKDLFHKGHRKKNLHINTRLLLKRLNLHLNPICKDDGPFGTEVGKIIIQRIPFEADIC